MRVADWKAVIGTVSVALGLFFCISGIWRWLTRSELEFLAPSWTYAMYFMPTWFVGIGVSLFVVCLFFLTRKETHVRSPVWIVTIAAGAALTLFFGLVATLGGAFTPTLFLSGARFSAGLTFLSLLLAYLVFPILLIGILLLVFGLFTLGTAEHARPFRKTVIALLCVGSVLLVIGGVVFVVGLQPRITALGGWPGDVASALTLSPKEQYISQYRVWGWVNEPPLAPDDPPPYIQIHYDVTGNLELHYKNSTGHSISTCGLSGHGDTKLSTPLTDSPELVLENVGDTEAKVSSVDAIPYSYGLREDPKITIAGTVQFFIGIAVVGAGFILLLHDKDKI